MIKVYSSWTLVLDQYFSARLHAHSMKIYNNKKSCKHSYQHSYDSIMKILLLGGAKKNKILTFKLLRPINTKKKFKCYEFCCKILIDNHEKFIRIDTLGVIQILFIHCLNIAQIMYEFCLDIVQILPK